MSETAEVRDFFGNLLHVGDIATAAVDEDGDAWLALVRVEALLPPYNAKVHVLDREENPGFVTWNIWHRKLIWCSSDYADINDTFVKDVFNASAD